LYDVFNTGLGEVHSEMARGGFHYGRTAVAQALIDLVKGGVLNREDAQDDTNTYRRDRQKVVN